MLLSIFAKPGLKMSKLTSYGVENGKWNWGNGEYRLFTGKHRKDNNTTHIVWGNQTYSVGGR